jgi:hypothetical protein
MTSSLGRQSFEFTMREKGRKALVKFVPSFSPVLTMNFQRM